MRQRAVLMLVLACVMGGTAVFLARGWLERQNRPQMIVATPQAPVQPALTTVVVAKIPLRFGDELNRENLRVVNWPGDAMPEGGFTSIDEVLAGNERRVALREIGANEPLLKGRVSGFGGRATLSALVGPDMRAVTIRVNDVQGVAGFVLPGDRVDVIFTRPEGAADTARPQTPPIADVLLQNLKVLAVDQLADSQKDKPVPAKAITLEATTEEAQKLTLASQVGTLSLTLRNFANSGFADAGTITVSGLLSRSSEPASAAPTAALATVPLPSSHSVRIVRGIDSSMQDVAVEQKRPANQPAVPAKPPQDPSRVAWIGAAAKPADGTP